MSGVQYESLPGIEELRAVATEVQRKADELAVVTKAAAELGLAISFEIWHFDGIGMPKYPQVAVSVAVPQYTLSASPTPARISAQKLRENCA